MQGLEEYGLRLSKEKRYSLEDSGLTKLVFDKDSVNLFQNGFPHKIVALRLRLDEYIWNSQVSEEEYERLICPVYMVEGKFVDFSGTIHGVIRPVELESGVYPELFPNLPPQFHFYIDGGFEGDEIGCGGSLEKDRLIYGIMDWKSINKNEITPKFRIKLSPDAIRMVYFERDK